ncbi:MAG: hypothetical protein D6709_03835 [Chloroflexi bacterium]|uniref:Uncharacterized protein n=1 Tax=Candidatus Thermofonsia Clade 3 bacterium TaxID=2364212 RepID=A0A2M8QEF7_9CHLR|nr:MAG: hypothetical protein CUN48_04715 [Candidatus Thermofonsia Clade 3 bacterium]RMG65024.1 MAG: hypothetical protein D6709_03835 [Chloroflexota bacterium]
MRWAKGRRCACFGFAIDGLRLEIGDWRLEIGDWRLEIVSHHHGILDSGLWTLDSQFLPLARPAMSDRWRL